MNWWPMHSWHPVLVHLPLVGLTLAVGLDLVVARNRAARWRDAATVLWWLGLLGAVAAVTTGLLAYNRVEHSDPAHVEMTLHRNLALAARTPAVPPYSGSSAPGSWVARDTWEEISSIATPSAFPLGHWE